MKKILIWLQLSIILNCAMAQQDQIVEEFYKNEWKSHKSFIRNNIDKSLDTTYDVKFYHLSISVAIDAPYIEGRLLCSFKPNVFELQSIHLDLHSSLIIDSIGGDVAGFQRNEDLVEIYLDSEYGPNDSVVVIIYYQGVPVPAGGFKGMIYETHHVNQPVVATLSTPYLAHYWFPCKDGPEDKADSIYMDITIPDTVINGLPLMAISNGILEEISTFEDKATFNWRHRYPIVTYYMMIAISNYVEFQQPPVNGVPLEYYCFEEDLTESMEGVELLPDAFSLYCDLFGPYPFADEKYGMTQIGFYGGIENQTNSIMKKMTFSWLFISVHELAHMWFGDMITLKNWHHVWLNEGFATYAEALFAEYLYGYETYQTFMDGREFFGEGTLFLVNAADTFNTFQSIYYKKGAWVLHMMRGMLGDETFFECLYNYASDPQLKYKNASTADLQAVCEETSGMDLDFYFDQWIFDEYFPIYYWGWQQDSQTFEITLQINQMQEALFGRRPLFEMPVQMKFIFEDETDSLVTVWNDQQWQSFSIPLDKEVVAVEFDPENWLLKHKEFVPGLVGIESRARNQEPRLVIYPNPAEEYFFVYLADEGQIQNVRVYGLDGRLVLENSQKAQNNALLRIETMDLEGGIYIVSVEVEGLVYFKKVVLR